MRPTTSALALAAATVLVSSSAFAAQLTPGSLIVYRVGTGTGSLINTGNPVVLDEYSPTGTLIQSINTGIFASGTATNEGMLTRSTDGKSIVFTGYAAASTISTNISTVNANQNITRVVARLLWDGSVSVNPLSGDINGSGNAPRSAATDDGNYVWFGGSSGGVRVVQWGASSSTQVNSGSLINIRTVSIYGGQLYGTSQSTVSGTPHRIYTVGTGLPFSPEPVSLLAGIPSIAGGNSTSPNQIALFDLDANTPGLDTLYVADDGSTATNVNTVGSQGIQKWTLSNGTWNWSGVVSAAGVRGLTAVDTGAGIQIFGSSGTNTATGGGTLYSFLDTTGFGGSISGASTGIATAATNTTFRGVAFAAIPEPTVMGLLAPAGLLLSRRRKA